MATSITNVRALSVLIEFARNNGCPDVDAIAKMEAHLAQLSKPKTRSNAPTKTQVLNKNLCNEVFAFISEKGYATAKDVAENMGSPYVTTAQKATILLGMLVADGRAIRHVNKGRAFWVVADPETANA